MVATKVLVMLPTRYRAVGRSAATGGEVVHPSGVVAGGAVTVLDPNDNAGDPGRDHVVQCSFEVGAGGAHGRGGSELPRWPG